MGSDFALNALGALRSGFALDTLWSNFALDTLRSLKTRLPLDTLGTRLTLGALRTRRAAQQADAGPGPVTVRDETLACAVALTAVGDDIQIARQGANRQVGVEHLALDGEGRAHLALNTLRTLGSGLTLNALRTLSARFALYTLWALRSSLPLDALWPLGASFSLDTLRTLGSCSARGSGVALGALDTLDTLDTLETLGALRTRLALRPLGASFTLNTLDTLRPGFPLGSFGTAGAGGAVENTRPRRLGDDLADGVGDDGDDVGHGQRVTSGDTVTLPCNRRQTSPSGHSSSRSHTALPEGTSAVLSGPTLISIVPSTPSTISSSSDVNSM